MKDAIERNGRIFAANIADRNLSVVLFSNAQYIHPKERERRIKYATEKKIILNKLCIFLISFSD
jgi:hypothetical protein